MKKVSSIRKVTIAVSCGLFFLIFFATPALAGTAVLNWNANSEGDLAGYKIYYDTTSRAGNCPGGYASNVNAGNVTNYTLNSLPEGHVYYFQITAYDTAGNQSACSVSPGERQKVITYLADFDSNRAVNLFDYNTLVTNYGTAQGRSGGDANGNGTVDLFDYNQLAADYGRSF